MSDTTTPNPIDAAIERHIWPDGDWHHETCRCGAAHPCDAGILARSTSTALEELDFHNRRANHLAAQLAAVERERDAAMTALAAMMGCDPDYVRVLIARGSESAEAFVAATREVRDGE